MMVLGLGDIVFCLFGWGGGGSKLESPGAGIFFFFFFLFFFTGEADSHGSFIFFYLLRVLSINLPAKGNISNGNDE